jgi:hypothetical protein
MSDREQSFKDRVRECAYFLWRSEGCPEGRSEEFWLRAQSRIESNDKSATQGEAASGGDLIDFESEQSFPASDVPGYHSSTGLGRHETEADR